MSSVFNKKEEKPTKKLPHGEDTPTPPHCFQRTTGEFEGVLQTPLMPCPAVCCKVSEAVCPYNGKSDTGTGKLCFSVSVGVAYGTGQIEIVKGKRVEISARKYYPYLDWLKAERLLLLVALKQIYIVTFNHKTKNNYKLSGKPPHSTAVGVGIPLNITAPPVMENKQEVL